MTGLIVRGWQARPYPTHAQADRLSQWAGSLRFLWNRLLDREKAEYEATAKFIWRKQLQPIAVGMKHEDGLEWLADLPAHAMCGRPLGFKLWKRNLMLFRMRSCVRPVDAAP